MIIKHVTTDCTHCGLPVPAGLVKASEDQQFCCGGCRAAWQLINASGLDSFYRMVDASSDRSSLKVDEDTAQPTATFAELDEPGFIQKFASHDAGVSVIKLAIDGLHCAACVWLIEKLPTMVHGVIAAQVNWARRTVEIRWLPDRVSLSEIAIALHRLGYKAHPLRKNETMNRRDEENRRQLIQIGIAAAAAGNNMIIAAALYLGMFAYMSAGMETLLRIASCVVGVASFLGPGRVFLRGALNSLKARTPHMDLPIAVGLSVGSVAGLVNTIRGVGEIYFDSLSVLICLLLIGRWIQFRQQNRAADAVDMLYRLTPQRARKITGRSIAEVSVDELELDDLIEVRPGDLIAVDGMVSSGHSQVDESILTGESKAVQKQVGDIVLAGTKNVSSPVVVRVAAVGTRTRIGGIMELVENASAKKPAIVQWADQIGGYFVVTVLVLAAVTFATWMWFDASRAVDRAVALLIVACPCALAMATPLAIAVALGRLANQKILVKSGDVLQSLCKPGMVWLDKTGTLTEGKLEVTEWNGDRKWLNVVSEIESKFSHPIAHAFVEFVSSGFGQSTDSDRLKQPVIEDVQSLNGGATAIADGKAFVVGNRQLVMSSNVVITKQWDTIESKIVERGESPCWVACDQKVVGVASIGDRIRVEAKPVVDALKREGWRVGILSGDHSAVVETVANHLGIEHVYSAVTPEQKLEIVQSSPETDEFTGPTVMVGDGVNDSAALAAASVGIAVEGGAEASLSAAPVYLGANGLAAILDLLKASRSTTRTIRINFVASLAFNVLGVTLAAIGWLDPLVAAILMPISSLTVLAISTNAAKASSPSLSSGT